ncbi:uncharacterized protein LOC144411628 [Styela clava]
MCWQYKMQLPNFGKCFETYETLKYVQVILTKLYHIRRFNNIYLQYIYNINMQFLYRILLACIAVKWTAGLKCQVGYESISSNSPVTIKTQKLKKCPVSIPRPACMKITSTVEGSGKAIYYACSARVRCSRLTCATSKEFIKSSMGARFRASSPQVLSASKNCKIACCEEDNCNSNGATGKGRTKNGSFKPRTTRPPRTIQTTPSTRGTGKLQNPKTSTPFLSNRIHSTNFPITTTVLPKTEKPKILPTTVTKPTKQSSVTSLSTLPILTISGTCNLTVSQSFNTDEVNRTTDSTITNVQTTLNEFLSTASIPISALSVQTDKTIYESPVFTKAANQKSKSSGDSPPFDDAFIVTENMPRVSILITTMETSNSTDSSSESITNKFSIQNVVTDKYKMSTTSSGSTTFIVQSNVGIPILFCISLILNVFS